MKKAFIITSDTGVTVVNASKMTRDIKARLEKTDIKVKQKYIEAYAVDYVNENSGASADISDYNGALSTAEEVLKQYAILRPLAFQKIVEQLNQ